MMENLAIDNDLDKKRQTTASQDPSQVNLSYLVTNESLFSFKQLKLISCAQLEEKRGVQPEQGDCPGNDPAERAIELITNYSQIFTKNESDRQAILQTVERHRQLNLHHN